MLVFERRPGPREDQADAAHALRDSHWLYQIALANENHHLYGVGPQNSPRLPKYEARPRKHGFVLKVR